MHLKEINKDEWDEVANSVALCELPFSVKEVEKKIRISFFEYMEEGLGICFGAYIKTSNSKVFMAGYTDKENTSPGVIVYMRSFEENPKQLMSELLLSLEIEERYLPWVCEDLSAPNWAVTRLDDNNNEFEVGRFLTKENASCIKRMYENKPHKQSYFVQNLSESKDSL